MAYNCPVTISHMHGNMTQSRFFVSWKQKQLERTKDCTLIPRKWGFSPMECTYKSSAAQEDGRERDREVGGERKRRRGGHYPLVDWRNKGRQIQRLCQAGKSLRPRGPGRPPPSSHLAHSAAVPPLVTSLQPQLPFPSGNPFPSAKPGIVCWHPELEAGSIQTQLIILVPWGTAMQVWIQKTIEKQQTLARMVGSAGLRGMETHSKGFL